MDAPKTRELDSIALNIELTLISIIQGVALYFLVEYSRPILIGLQYIYWPYVAAALAFIFLLWSRVILHALTIIRWPLEFVHNFLYIAVTLVQCITFTQVGHPLAWFIGGAAFSVLMWFLFVWDTGLIPPPELCTPKQISLCSHIRKEQHQSIRLWMPLVFLYNAGAAWAIHHWPHFFIDERGHILLIGVQFAATVYFLGYSLKFYRKIMPIITQVREEEDFILSSKRGRNLPRP